MFSVGGMMALMDRAQRPIIHPDSSYHHACIHNGFCSPKEVVSSVCFPTLYVFTGYAL